MKKLVFVTLFHLLLSCLFIKANHGQQNYPFSGYIYDTKTGEPVHNANILVVETQIGTSSGPDGSFELKLDEGEYNLRISYLGFSEMIVHIRVPVKKNNEKLIVGIKPENFDLERFDVLGRFSRYNNDSLISREPVSLLPSITRISALDMERQGAVTMMDAIRYVPGGWVESRGRKTKQFFSVRGQKYPYPGYSINGIWQKEFEETVYFFPALDIESIEIVRSGSAIVKGLSGLTGVVDVRTKTPEKETISMTAKYGEQNQYFSSLQYGNRTKRISYYTSLALFGTDGPANRNGKERIASFYGNMGWDINARIKLQAGATYINGLREFISIVEPGASNIMQMKEKFDPVRTLLSYVKVNHSGKNGSLTELQTNFTYRNADYAGYHVVRETTTVHQEKDWEYGFNLLHERPVSRSNTLRVGMLYNHWVAPVGKRYYFGRKCDIHTWSAVVASEQQAGRFTLDGAFRLIGGEIVEWGGFGIEGSSAGLQNVAPIVDQPAPLEWQSALGVSYMASQLVSLHYNFSGGTIAPRKGALNNNGESPVNEIRFQHDLGCRFNSDKKYELSVNAFYTNMIHAIELSGETVTADNSLLLELYENSNKRSYGIECSGKYVLPGFPVSFFVNTLFMKGEKELSGVIRDDKQLPKVILNSGLMMDYRGIDANLYMYYTGPYTNNRFVNPSWRIEHGDFPLGDFVSADLTAGYTVTGKYSTRIFIEVKNLLNIQYLTVAGYPDPGRLSMLGVKVLM